MLDRSGSQSDLRQCAVVYGRSMSIPTTAQVDDAQVYMLYQDATMTWTWHREYDFDSVYGRGTIDAAHLVERAAGDLRRRARAPALRGILSERRRNRADHRLDLALVLVRERRADRQPNITACAMPQIDARSAAASFTTAAADSDPIAGADRQSLAVSGSDPS